MSNYSVKKIIRNTDTYCVNGGGGGTSINPFGDGSDGDITITGSCCLEAKEYNFNDFTMCGTVRFYGQGVPVIRVCGTAKLCNGSFCLCSGSVNNTDYLSNYTLGTSYPWAGQWTNKAGEGEPPLRVTDECAIKGGWGTAKGGGESSPGETYSYCGTTRCGGGAASGENGGGGGGYTTAGGAATASAGGAGGSSTFSGITYDSNCGRLCTPNGAGGGYGCGTGGAGGALIMCNVQDNGFNGEGIEAGYGGGSKCKGGNGGCLCAYNGAIKPRFTAGRGGDGKCCGGNGGIAYIFGGTYNAYNSTTGCGGLQHIYGGAGGCGYSSGGCGGDVCICSNTVLCGISLRGGKGGDAVSATGGRGGCVRNRNTAQLCTCYKVCPNESDSTMMISGGDGGRGYRGGAGGGVSIQCCNGVVESILKGGRGGDGMTEGGKGGDAYAGCGVTFCHMCRYCDRQCNPLFDIMGGDGGNAIGGSYSVLLAANVLCSCCCARVYGPGGCGGNGGDIGNSTTTLLHGRPGHGGNGSDGGNMSIIYGTCFGEPIGEYLCGGKAGLAGHVTGCILNQGAHDGNPGKKGCLRIMQFKE